jgi:aryl-alcohol dehydrogenase-like predicted oxidoreductase
VCTISETLLTLLSFRTVVKKSLYFTDFILAHVQQWGPLYAGILARPVSERDSTARAITSLNKKALDDSDFTILKRVEVLAEKKQWKRSQVALVWINKRVSSPIVGFSSIERLDEALGVVGKTLTEDEEQYLEEPYKPKEISGHS